VLITFLASLPTLILRTSVVWLRVQSVLIVACAMFTLVLGLQIWYTTLTTTTNLATTWKLQSIQSQILLQTKFQCCGYLNSSGATPDFRISTVCPNALEAAKRPACSGPFSDFANSYLGMIFTGSFGLVGMLLLKLN
jgi:hypothetical protein